MLTDFVQCFFKNLRDSKAKYDRLFLRAFSQANFQSIVEIKNQVGFPRYVGRSRLVERKLGFEGLELKRLLSGTPVIIDNSSPGFSASGSWVLMPPNSVGYNGGYLWAPAPFNGSDGATWTFNVTPGSYRLSGTWAPNPLHATTLGVGLWKSADNSFGNYLGIVGTLNQTIAPDDFNDSGAWWESIGVFTTTTGVLRVVVTDNNSGGAAIADAYRLDPFVPSSLAIINNDAAGFTKSGAWNFSSAGLGGSSYYSTFPFQGSEIAQWTFPVTPGLYRVSGAWAASPYHGTNVPLGLNAADGTVVGNVLLNQQNAPDDFIDNGAWWETIGVFNVNSSQLRLRMSDNANAGAFADAFRIERINQVSTTAIVDNTGSAFSKTGAWSGASAGYGNSMYFNSAPHDGSESATWSFYIEPGTYEVEATWPMNPGHATNSPFTVWSGATLLRSIGLNQTAAPDDRHGAPSIWQSLGKFIVSGNTLQVKLSDLANGYVVTDAVRIRRVSDPIIVDNGGGSQFTTTGAWTTENTQGYKGSRVISTLPNDGIETATWTFNVTPGTYFVSSHWGTAQLTNASDAPVELLDNQNIVTRTFLNQQLTPDDRLMDGVWWENVGSITTTTGVVRVRMRDSANGRIVADAFQLTPVSKGISLAIDDLSYFTNQSTDLVIATGGVLTNDKFFSTGTQSARVVSGPSNGSLVSFTSQGTFTYRPNSGFVGVDEFTYVAIQDGEESKPVRVAIAVGTPLSANLVQQSQVLESLTDCPCNATSSLDLMGQTAFGQGISNVENPEAILRSGGLQLSEDVVPSVNLVYRSDSLTRPILAAHLQLAPGLAAPTAISARLNFNGVAGPTVQYNPTLPTGGRFRIALQADGASLATGMYDYTIEVNLTVGGITRTQLYSGKQSIVNRAPSEFGPGWAVHGVDRIHVNPSGAMLVKGNGDMLWFPKEGSVYGFAEGDAYYSRLSIAADGTFLLKSKQGMITVFSSSGLVIKRVDPNGNEWNYAYADRDNDGLVDELISITDPYSRSISFQYTGNRVTSIQHFSGRTTTLEYAAGMLTAYNLTDPDGAGPLAAPRIVFGYNGSQLFSRRNALNETTEFVFDAIHGRLTRVIDPASSQIDKNWRLTSQDTLGLPLASTGNSLFEIDNTDNIEEPTIPRFASMVTDERGSKWTYQTDRFGNIVKSVTPRGYVQTTLRNSAGQIIRVTEPDPDGAAPALSPVTTTVYDSFGDPVVYMDAEGGVSRFAYSTNWHRKIAAIDPVGRTELYNFDAKANLTSSVDGAGFVTSYTYNVRGIPTSTRLPDPDGSGPLGVSQYTLGYDALFRLTSVTNPDNSVRFFAFNSADQMFATTDELQKTTWFSYDLLGRNTGVSNRIGVGNFWAYDAMSRPTRFADGLLNPTDIEYNNRGWISKVIYPDPDGPTGPLVRAEDIRTYQPNGNLETRRDPRGNFQGTLSYRYDNDNRLEFSSDSLYGALRERYQYDNRGLLIGIERVKTDANPAVTPTEAFTKIVDNRYDAVGRLVKRLSYDFPPPGSQLSATLFSETFKHNAAGELVERVDGTGESDVGNRYFNVYDQRGLLVQETQPDPDGSGPLFPLVLKYGYDNMGRQTLVDRGYGRVTRTEYNSRDWVTKVTQPDPDGSGPLPVPVTQIGYDLRGDQSFEIDPLNRITWFGFDAEQRLAAKTEPDPDGSGPLSSSTTYFGYNANNWLIRIFDPVGAITDFTYDALGRKTSTIAADPDGSGSLSKPISTHTYAMNGLKTTVDPMGRVTSYVRDSRGRVENMTDALGNLTSYTYDFYDNLRTRKDPDPDGSGPLPQPEWEWFYDPLNRVTSEFDPEDKRLRYQYDSASGKVSHIIDRAANTTYFKYDNLNRLIEEENQNLDARTYTYNVAGNLTRTVDRNNKVTQYTYDTLDRPTTEQWLAYGTPLYPVTTTPQTSVNEIQKGSKVGQQDSTGWTTNATGLSGTFTLSFNGQTTAPIAWDASAATIQAAFQALSSVGAGNATVSLGVPSGAGVNIALSKNINVTFRGALDGLALPRIAINTTALVRTGGLYLSNSTPLSVVVNGQVIKEKQIISIDGLQSGTSQISYGNEVSAPLSSNITQLELKNVLDAFVGIDNVSVFFIQSLGSIPSSIQVEFGGSQAGLDMALLQVDTSNLIGGELVRTITTNYNTSSEVISVVDPSSTVTFSRDNMGRATTVATTIAGLGQAVTLNQAFDAVSNRTELRATIGNTPDFKNTYTYDKLKRLTDVVQTGQAGGNAVVAKHIKQAFNASNQRTNITRYQSSGTANLVASTNFTFDTVGRLDGIQHLRQGAINLNSYSYTYDGMSRLSNVTSTAEGTATFSYDSSSQLKSAIGTQPTESYAYDDNGNRNTTGYVTGTDNRTTSDPNFNYEYDAEGNLIRKTSKTNSQDDTLYQYDHRNRLTRVQFGPISGANNYVTYEYDGFDRLVRRFSVGPPTYFSEATYWIYDEGINPVLELTNNFSGNGYVTHRYLWSNSVDDLLADEQVNPSNNTANTLYPLSDHLGSIRDIADFDEATGITAIANHRRYNSFGKLVNETGTADIAFGYTGKLYDKKTGLQNNWNRWYDPNLGKWISQDPIGFAAGDANLYRYVGNSTTNFTDPSGLEKHLVEIQRPDGSIELVWVEIYEQDDYDPYTWPWYQEYERPEPPSRYGEIGPATEWHRQRDQQEYERESARYRMQLYGQLYFAGESLLAASRGVSRGMLPRVPSTAPRPPMRPPTTPTAPVRTAAERATEIHQTLGKGTQRRTTTAVTDTVEGVRVVSSSELRLRPAQRRALQSGEVEGVGPGHAEVTGVNVANGMGLTPTGTAASRPICPSCAGMLQQQGVQPLSPLKNRK